MAIGLVFYLIYKQKPQQEHVQSLQLCHSAGDKLIQSVIPYVSIASQFQLVTLDQKVAKLG